MAVGGRDCGVLVRPDAGGCGRCFDCPAMPHPLLLADARGAAEARARIRSRLHQIDELTVGQDHVRRRPFVVGLLAAPAAHLIEEPRCDASSSLRRSGTGRAGSLDEGAAAIDSVAAGELQNLQRDSSAFFPFPAGSARRGRLAMS